MHAEPWHALVHVVCVFVLVCKCPPRLDKAGRCFKVLDPTCCLPSASAHRYITIVPVLLLSLFRFCCSYVVPVLFQFWCCHCSGSVELVGRHGSGKRKREEALVQAAKVQSPVAAWISQARTPAPLTQQHAAVSVQHQSGMQGNKQGGHSSSESEGVTAFPTRFERLCILMVRAGGLPGIWYISAV